MPTLRPQDYPRRVTFSYAFPNCTLAVLERNMAQMKTQIANTLNITEATMTEFNATCGSIIITYVQTHSSNLSSEAAVQALQTAIQQGNLNITVDNQVLVVVTDSLVINILTPNYATTAAPPIAVDDGLSGGAIAGIVIGVLIFVFIIAVVVYLLMCKKHTRKDNTVEPNENDVELRGKSS